MVEIWNRLKEVEWRFCERKIMRAHAKRALIRKNEPYKMNIKQDSQPIRALLIISLRVKRKASSKIPRAMDVVAPIAASKKLN